MTYLSEHWTDVAAAAGQHLLIAVVSLAIALLVALPLGVVAARVPASGLPIFAVLGTIYTIPSMALLGVLVLVEGLGFWTAVTALAAYAQMILVRNVTAAISGVDAAAVEAARGMGMSAWQVLWNVERPLATPLIVAGIRVASVSIIGIASVAAWVGAGGLGTLIFAGIDQGDDGKAVIGAIACAALALAVDASLRALERTSVSGRG